jgi:hypothetical protein
MEPAALDELIESWALLDEDRALVAGRRARPRWGSAWNTYAAAAGQQSAGIEVATLNR